MNRTLIIFYDLATWPTNKYCERSTLLRTAVSTANHKFFPGLTESTREDKLGVGGESPCEVPKPAYPIELTTEETKHLQHLIRAHTTAQTLAMRARIILKP